MIECFLKESILHRARQAGKIEISILNLRDWATDRHRTVDDKPYGGGPGMLIKVDVVDRAIASLKSSIKTPSRRQSRGFLSDGELNSVRRHQKSRIILLTPRGRRFNQAYAEELLNFDHIILIAGHYEGFDERVRALVDEELSLGDFVLTGGELPAVAVVDAVARLVPGVLGDEASPKEESFTLKSKKGQRLLEYPQYTRPETYKPISKKLGELKVPEILKSGDHKKIQKWRMHKARNIFKKRK